MARALHCGRYIGVRSGIYNGCYATEDEPESLALTDDIVADPDSCTSNATSGPGQQQYERESLEKRLSRQLRQAEADVQKLSTQVQQLLKESTMNTRRRPANSRDNTGQKRTDGPVCWGCGKKAM